jgi:hypothetical protein
MVPLDCADDTTHAPRQPRVAEPEAGLTTKCGAAEESRPRVAAAVAIKLARMGSHVLDPAVGKAIVRWSMLSASKSVPHPVAT